MRPSGKWEPLLHGELRADIEAATNRIAEDLAQLDPAAPLDSANDAASISLFFAYANELAHNTAYEDRANAWLDRAIDDLSTTPMQPMLHGGFVGIAWVVEHLVGDDGAEDYNAAIDAALLELLSVDHWSTHYDLVGGLVGLGVYALERSSHASGRRLAERVLDHLAANAEHGPEGTTWFTPAEWLPDWHRELAPEGFRNLGLAHGVSGAIAFLARAVANGIQPSVSRDLLDSSVRWLLSQRVADDVGLFARWTGRGAPKQAARAAWCYGDPGVAAALLSAAQATDSAAWLNEAVEVALSAAGRSEEDAGVVDSCLCHGAAGLAHVLNRLYQASENELLAEASRYWFARALSLGPPSDSYGMLDGTSGIGLAMLAALGNNRPGWDRILLLDLAC